MTWLDSAIGWLAPKAGLDRARARAALRLMRAYEGASTTRRTVNWRTSGASANAEISSGLPRLRARSRDLVRNNPYARRAIAALVGNAVGTGITLGSGSKPLLKAWKGWAAAADFYGDCDLYGLQALAARAVFESGDCLVIRVRTNSADAGPSGIPLKLKVLEGDFLDAGVTGPQSNGNMAVAGIEIDREGRRVAYHLFTVHPGESALVDPRSKSVRVPAEDVIYLFEKERPGQLLGVPRLAASIMRLRDLDEYQEALLVKKKIEACFAAFVSTDDDQRRVGTSTTTETDADGNSRKVERLSPGQILYGKVGESITFGQPSSSSDVGFTKDALHAIAAGIGCTYEQLTGDLSSVNYSSMRGGRQEFKTLVEQFRWLTFMPQFCERIYGWFEEAARNAGKLRSTGYEHTWTPPRWEYVNPKEDVQADKEELGAGLCSLSEKLRARGENPDEVFAEIAAERDKLEELGIKVDFVDAATAAAKPEKSAKTDAEDAPEDEAGRSIVVNVSPPAVTVDARTTVNVPEREVNVDASSQISVPERQVTIEQTVEAPAVNVAPAQVNVRAYPSETEETIERDERGEMTRVVRKTKD